MGHIVRRATPGAALQREPLPTTKISELRLHELVRETRAEDADIADGTPIEISTIAMPRLQRPDDGQVATLRTHDNSSPTRQLVAEPDPDAVTAIPQDAAVVATSGVEPLARVAVYPAAPGAGPKLPRVLFVVLVLAIGWLGASLIYAVR